MNRVRNVILAAGVVEPGYFEFAGGQVANNHLSAEILHEHPAVESFVVKKLGQLVVSFEPDGLVPIPSGGNRWAELVAEDLKVPVCYLQKTEQAPGHRAYSFASTISRVLARRKRRLVLIDDVGNRLTSIKGTLSVPELRGRVVGFAGIWLRNSAEIKKEVPIPTKWLVEEEIPLELPPDSRYFRQARSRHF